LRRIAAAAETYYIRVAPHNPNGPVATAASIQLAAAMPNFDILESVVIGPEYSKMLIDPPKHEEGHFVIPERPGLGIDLNEEVFADFPYKQKSYDGVYYTDGGIADV
jgi:galactonate dehydratase